MLKDRDPQERIFRSEPLMIDRTKEDREPRDYRHKHSGADPRMLVAAPAHTDQEHGRACNHKA